MESIDGNLIISGAKDKNITIKILGNGYFNVHDIDLISVAVSVNLYLIFLLFNEIKKIVIVIKLVFDHRAIRLEVLRVLLNDGVMDIFKN